MVLVGEEKNNLVVYSPCDAIGDVADLRSAVRKDLWVRIPPGVVKGEDMCNGIILKALDERDTLMRHMCENGVQDADQYEQACEMIGLLLAVKERTVDQESLLTSLYSATGVYEEKYYPFGN